MCFLPSTPSSPAPRQAMEEYTPEWWASVLASIPVTSADAGAEARGMDAPGGNRDTQHASQAWSPGLPAPAEYMDADVAAALNMYWGPPDTQARLAALEMQIATLASALAEVGEKHAMAAELALRRDTVPDMAGLVWPKTAAPADLVLPVPYRDEGVGDHGVPALPEPALPGPALAPPEPAPEPAPREPPRPPSPPTKQPSRPNPKKAKPAGKRPQKAPPKPKRKRRAKPKPKAPAQPQPPNPSTPPPGKKPQGRTKAEIQAELDRRDLVPDAELSPGGIARRRARWRGWVLEPDIPRYSPPRGTINCDGLRRSTRERRTVVDELFPRLSSSSSEGSPVRQASSAATSTSTRPQSCAAFRRRSTRVSARTSAEHSEAPQAQRTVQFSTPRPAPANPSSDLDSLSAAESEPEAQRHITLEPSSPSVRRRSGKSPHVAMAATEESSESDSSDSDSSGEEISENTRVRQNGTAVDLGGLRPWTESGKYPRVSGC